MQAALTRPGVPPDRTVERPRGSHFAAFPCFFHARGHSPWPAEKASLASRHFDVTCHLKTTQLSIAEDSHPHGTSRCE